MTFDADKFMNQPAAPMATVFELIKEGEYLFMLDTDIEFKEIKWQDRTTGHDRSAPVLEIPLIVQDAKGGAEEKARLGRDKLTVKASIGVDLDTNGQFETGPNKNVLLGQLREALGQNNDPDWRPSKLKGAGPVIGKVTHRADKTDPQKKYAEVKKFAKVS